MALRALFVIYIFGRLGSNYEAANKKIAKEERSKKGHFNMAW